MFEDMSKNRCFGCAKLFEDGAELTAIHMFWNEEAQFVDSSPERGELAGYVHNNDCLMIYLVSCMLVMDELKTHSKIEQIRYFNTHFSDEGLKVIYETAAAIKGHIMFPGNNLSDEFSIN